MAKKKRCIIEPVDSFWKAAPERAYNEPMEDDEDDGYLKEKSEKQSRRKKATKKEDL